MISALAATPCPVIISVKTGMAVTETSADPARLSVFVLGGALHRLCFEQYLAYTQACLLDIQCCYTHNKREEHVPSRMYRRRNHIL